AQHPLLDPWLTKNFIKDHSKANALPMKSKQASSFHEFACNTSDAWDVGDDEDEDFSSSSSSLQTLNSKVAKATAAQVLENHSKLRAKPERAQSALSDVPTNCKVIKSSSEAQLSRTACVWTPLQKQQSLPLQPIIPLVTRISDQNASGAPPMMLREKTHLEKFRQLLSSHNRDLDEQRKCSWPGVPREVWSMTWRLLSVSTRSCDVGVWGECAEPGTCAARPLLCPVTRFAHFVSVPSLRVSCTGFFGQGV
uniref:Uncharacterized protein n=1 Tax=Strix occidentalis caurina TaxID=311401 RepID=A0A8D0F7A5_STROC